VKISRRAALISPSPTLAIDTKAKALKAQGVEVINFSAGEPDFDTPQHIKAAAVQALEEGFTRYTPVAGIPELRREVARYFSLRGLSYSPEEIVVSCGAKQSLYNALQVLLEEGEEAVLISPYWVSYHEQVKLAGGKPVVVHTDSAEGFKVTPEALEAALTPRTRAVILNSPCNPTGAVYTRQELESLAELARERDIWVISDEIYSALLYDGLQHVSIASFPGMKERSIVVDGASKTYAMTGWRIGFAAAPLPIAQAMISIQSHSTSNPNSIAQKAVLAALRGSQESVEKMRLEFDRRRLMMLEGLRAIPGIKCHRPGGAFYLFPDVGELLGKRFRGRILSSSLKIAEVLLEEFRVAVVPGEAFGAPGYLRLSYATSRDQIEKGLKALSLFVEQLD